MARGHFLFLGTGAALGVPVVACGCRVCQSTSPYNQRLRPAGLVTIEHKHFLVDAGPDIRSQALKYQIKHVDGVLLTHTHFDHIGGFDDLRPYAFFQGKPLPCLLSEESFKELKFRYHYLMEGVDKKNLTPKHFVFQLLEKEFGTVDFLDTPMQYVTYFQAGMRVTGYRFGNLAYVSDIRKYTQEVIEALKGVKTLIVSALRLTPSDVHFSVDEARAFAESVGAQQTFFTHISHDLDHEEMNRNLPSHIQLSHDGLQIPFEI